MQIKLNRLIYNLKRSITRERLVVGVIVVAAIIFVANSIGSMSRTWELNQRVTTRQRELELLKLEIETLEMETIYYASEEYQELAARAKQNKIGEGEVLVYLPKNSDIAMHKHKKKPTEEAQVTEPSNIRQWLSFLFGSQ